MLPFFVGKIVSARFDYFSAPGKEMPRGERRGAGRSPATTDDSVADVVTRHSKDKTAGINPPRKPFLLGRLFCCF